ncbi:NusG domain II-containing protein [Niallia sp. Krafla_26]|uniref:NusG domain II-containing protein n=1 Tax=Niallia sp. Krafla_26 TaxID=3064703 RepID=UPI003D16C9EE
MWTFSNMIKRWDIIITLFLVLLSFLPIIIFSYQQAEKTNAEGNGEPQTVAVISVNNEEVRRITLTGNTETEVFDIFTDDGDYNTIEVRGESIRIKGANCYDQVCVQFGFLSRPGETAVCLPHKLVLEIQSTAGENIDDMIISS